ncbi:pentatricopeptide repeat-containing protein [Panicum miliaceum]|uniref:Pentatricopeptide repeat-containing protein n=1 Tax=Panicum miliaceum TaxID=4540 RepID=A0A3L6T5A5_PANMI|nr:pentatricopeptide repeat-containing protein [Panicum miliaceum]
MASAPATPPSPSPSPDARPPRVVRAPPRRPPPRAPGPPPWAERRPAVSVDLDRGRRAARAEVDGVRAASLPARHRLRVEGTRWQRDWKVSEAAARVLALPHADAHAVDAVLNCWAGRFARRNFPLLIRENYCARNDIYGMMIRLHARHNQVDQARGLFFEMQEWRCKPDADTYNSLIHAHARAGQWRWAINIMEDMQRAAIPPSRTTYNNVINACGAAGNWKKALDLCKKMTENGVGPDLITHNIILSAFKNGAQYLKAIAYFEIMKSSNVAPDTFTQNIVIHCLVKVGRYGEAIELFNSMREKRTICPPDVVTYTSIMYSYSVCGQAENCKAVFDMMVAEGVRPNIVSYNALLGAYASHGMHKEALDTFKSLKQNGLRPDIVSYTSLLNVYGRSAQPEKAREVFNEMRKNACKPNKVSYNALIDAYGSAGMLKEAISLLHEMERDGIQPDVVSISTLLTACGRCRQLTKIDTILAAAKSRGIELNTVAYNSGIGSYLSLGDYEKALELYALMRTCNVKPDAVTYNVLISGSCKLGRYAESLKFFEDMMDLKIHLTKEVYSSVICSYVKQGKLSEAESTFSSMKESGCFPDVLTYTAMIKAYSDDGSWRRAWDLFKEMESNDVQPDAIVCSSLMEALNNGSQPERVLQLMKFMKQKQIPLNQKAYFEIIASCSISCVALLQQKDQKLSQIFYGQKHDEEKCKYLCPISGGQFQRWNCSNCLKKVQNADHGRKSRTISVNQDGCSISFIRSFMPSSVGRSTASKCSQESDLKCISPSSGNKGVIEENAYPAMKDLQASSSNHAVNSECNVSGVPKPILRHSNVHSGDQVHNRVYQRRSGKKRLLSEITESDQVECPADKDVHQDFASSFGNLNQKKLSSTTSANHAHQNMQNSNMEGNMKDDDQCNNVTENSKQMFLSKGESTIFIKKKLQPSASDGDENTESYPPTSHMENSLLQVQTASVAGAVDVQPTTLHISDLLKCPQEEQSHSHMEQEVTIACGSPTFSQPQNISEVSPISFLITEPTMGANNLCDGGMAGQSGLYPGETMPAMHLPGLMDSSSASGFLNYEVPNTNWMGSQYAHSQYQTSFRASYGSHLIEEVPLTPKDLSRHNVQQDMCRPFRPHPRVGVFGSLLQQEIANLSKNCVWDTVCWL